MKNEFPLVAIRMVTYNHKKYIAKAIESALMQKTNFPFILVIGEDCSTDGTREICIEYQKKFPDKIKLLLANVNNMRKNAIDTFRQCVISSAKYMAYLEGDDYWTDPMKLQKQVDFLEQDPDVSGCFHDVVAVNESDEIININYFNSTQTHYNQQEVLLMGSSYATCSLMFRCKVLNPIPDWLRDNMCDFTLDMQITEFGSLAYIPENMAAYRIHSQGMWQGEKPVNNLQNSISYHLGLLQNEKYKNKYYKIISNRIKNMSADIASYYAASNSTKRIKYAWYYWKYNNEKSWSQIKITVGSYLFPHLYKLIKKR